MFSLPRLLSLLLLIGPGHAAMAQEARPENGQVFAETHCASCHAVGRGGSSPLAEAPPFRELHRRYPVEQLAEALAEGISTGHPTMPEFELDPPQIDDLLAYLRSLEH